MLKKAKDKEKKARSKAIGHGKGVLNDVLGEVDFEGWLVAERGQQGNLAKAPWLSWYSQLDSKTHHLKVVGGVVFSTQCGTNATGRVRTSLHEMCKVTKGETIPLGSTCRRNQLAQSKATGTGCRQWPDGDHQLVVEIVPPPPPRESSLGPCANSSRTGVGATPGSESE